LRVVGVPHAGQLVKRLHSGLLGLMGVSGCLLSALAAGISVAHDNEIGAITYALISALVLLVTYFGSQGLTRGEAMSDAVKTPPALRPADVIVISFGAGAAFVLGLGAGRVVYDANANIGTSVLGAILGAVGCVVVWVRFFQVFVRPYGTKEHGSRTESDSPPVD